MQIMMESGDWCYVLAQIDTPSVELGPFASFVDLWRSKHRDGKLPDWHDFDLMEFKEWWGWLTVIDIFSDDIRDHRYRLWGSLLANATETEMTGRRMADNWGEVNDASTYTDADLEFLKVMRKGENIGLYMGPIDGQFPGVRTLLTLRLPLSSNGGTVDRVMSATRITIPEETWRPTITADRQRNL